MSSKKCDFDKKSLYEPKTKAMAIFLPKSHFDTQKLFSYSILFLSPAYSRFCGVEGFATETTMDMMAKFGNFLVRKYFRTPKCWAGGKIEIYFYTVPNLHFRKND